MTYDLIAEGHIPRDKSWTIRNGILDLLHGKGTIIDFLQKEEETGEDLQALLRCSIAWYNGGPLDVGESGTIYRCLRYASWALGKDREFIKRGTLKNRNLCDNPEIINWPLEKILTLGTTQWATAAMLFRMEHLQTTEPKLQLTNESIYQWDKTGGCWEPRYDNTILKQAECYLHLLNSNWVDFVPEQAEDYCFARAFGYMTKEEGEARWPNLKGHESNRIISMEEALESAWEGRKIISDDHRVVQALVMWARVNKMPLELSNLQAVKKSWPQFWRFICETH